MTVTRKFKKSDKRTVAICVAIQIVIVAFEIEEKNNTRYWRKYLKRIEIIFYRLEKINNCRFCGWTLLDMRVFYDVHNTHEMYSRFPEQPETIRCIYTGDSRANKKKKKCRR